MTELLQQRGCTIKSTNPALQTLIDVVATLHRLGQDEFVALLVCYVGAAAAHVAGSHRTDVDSIAEGAIIGTVLGDVLPSALRRLAHEPSSAHPRTPFDSQTDMKTPDSHPSVTVNDGRQLVLDLHDTVAQTLAATVLQLGSARLALAAAHEHGEAEAAIAEAERLARQSMTELRRLARSLEALSSDTSSSDI